MNDPFMNLGLPRSLQCLQDSGPSLTKKKVELFKGGDYRDVDRPSFLARSMIINPTGSVGEAFEKVAAPNYREWGR